jgi:hypothetical protein
VAFKPTVSLEIPVFWQATDDVRTFRLTTTAILPSGAPAGDIEFRVSPVVGSNVCDGSAAAGVGTSVAEIIAALSADPRFATVSGGTISLGGRTGQTLDIRLASDWTETCTWSAGEPAAVLFTVADPPGPYIGLAGDDRIRVTLLGVDGDTVAISVSTSDTPYFEAFVTETRPILDSVTFTP